MPAVSLIIPALGAAAEAAGCIESLDQHLPSDCEVDLRHDAAPFTESCNQAMRNAVEAGRDVLLLHPRARITAGAVEEMRALLHLHEKHGVVTPRCNRAGVFSVPVMGPPSEDTPCELWRKMSAELPRYHVTPSGAGFCMLIRNEAMRHFGYFDPIYGGSAAATDFCCRINRRGYSSLAANRAFVHYSEIATPGPALLDQRYPEYQRMIYEYLRFDLDPVERFAVLWGNHRKRILFDLSHLPALHAGTAEFALALLVELAPLLEPRHDLYVSLRSEAREFFATALSGYPHFEDKTCGFIPFDLVFKPAQLFSWQEFHRMARLAARVCFTHQDSIAIRSQHLGASTVRFVQRSSTELADRVFTISHFSRADFAALHQRPANFQVIHHGSYCLHPEPLPKEGHILIMGNRFPHKGVREALEHLRGLEIGGSPMRICVLGGRAEDENFANVEWLVSGQLDRIEIMDLFANAILVVYPSYYEGFGLPVLDSLALGRPVVALDTEMNRELKTLTGSENLHLIATHAELRSEVTKVLAGPCHAAVTPRHWADVAREYAAAFEEMLAAPLDVEKMRRRWEWLAALDAHASLEW